MAQSEPAAIGAVLLGLWMVGITLMRTKLTVYGFQTVLLGLLAAWIGVRQHETALVNAGLAVALLKGVGVPIYLARVARKIGCRRDEGMLIAPPFLLFLTIGALASLALFRPFDEALATAGLPAIALIMVGMVLMVSRRLAISQILGFLVMENGMFLFTVAQPRSMPLVVELGVLLDALVATMLAGLLVFRIRDSFEHIDVSELKQLKG